MLSRKHFIPNTIMTPEETFICDLSIIAHTYILECRKKNKDISENIAPLVIAILEAEIDALRGE